MTQTPTLCCRDAAAFGDSPDSHTSQGCERYSSADTKSDIGIARRRILRREQSLADESVCARLCE